MQTERIEFFIAKQNNKLDLTTKNGIELDHFYISNDR